MEKDFGITIGDDGLPTQKFNGKDFKLYPREHYFSRGTKRIHVQVWESVNGKTPKGFHIHHKDGNTWNNSIDNLECIEGKKHLSIHGKERFKNNPEFAKHFQSKGIEKAKEWHKSKEGRLWHSEHGKRTWENREYKKHKCEQCGSEFESRHGGIVKFCHNNCKAKALRYRRKLERGGL